MTRVYIWPWRLGETTRFGGTQNRVRSEIGVNGAPVQRTEIQPRLRAEIAGQAPPSVHDDLMIFVDRLAGGVSLAGIWDLDRKRFGWDGEPAFNTATGAEFWHVSGGTSGYADNAADGVTWRSISAAAAGVAAADATSIAVDGLLPGEVIPKGCLARIGDYRYVVRAAVTANSGGAATLALSVPLRAAVADNQAIRLPGDFGVFSMVQQEIGPTDADGLTNFRLSFIEVYSDEFSDGFTYVVDAP